MSSFADALWGSIPTNLPRTVGPNTYAEPTLNNPPGQPLGQWYDDPRAKDPGWSFNVNSGWSQVNPQANQQAQQQSDALAQQQAQQKQQDDVNRALYDQQIGGVNNQIGQLPGQYDVGLSNYQNQYNQAISQLLQGQQRTQTGYNTTSANNLQDYNTAQAQGKQAYGTAKTQTAQDYSSAKNTIGANAGNSLNGLLRLLGSRGAGGSSAATIAAPGAVARQATIQRGDAGNAFGQNQQALDTNYNQNVAAQNTNFQRNKGALDTNLQNYLSDVNQQYTGLGTQLTDNTNALKAQGDVAKANLLNTLGGLTSQRWAISGLSPEAAVASGQPYLDQANSLNTQATQLGRLSPHDIIANAPNYQAPTIAPTPQYQAPSLASYISAPNAAPTYQGQAPANDFTSPFLGSLLGKKLPGTTAAG